MIFYIRFCKDFKSLTHNGYRFLPFAILYLPFVDNLHTIIVNITEWNSTHPIDIQEL
jgi:hypothetical protein